MTVFWIAAGLLTALTLALLSWPLLRKHPTASASRKALNTQIFRDQLAELDKDLSNGSLSLQEHAVAREELERRVLEDVAQDDRLPAEARRLPRTALSLAVLLPVAAVGLYLTLGNPAAMNGGGAKAPAPTAAEVEQMVAALAARLEKNPDNPQGWVMLGRSYKVMGRFQEAAQAFDKAGSAMESDPELMLEVAELSAELNQGRIEGRGAALLKKVLADQPDNPQALVLAGTDAFFREKYADAVRHWERLLAMVPADSQDAQNLSAGIARARSLMGKTDTVGATKAPEAAKAAATSVSGRVSVAPALAGKVAPGDTVFIFARAAQGPRMPLAVLRIKADELPKDFTLDDSMAMSPEIRLSSVAELSIEARVSKSGEAKAQPGDLSGTLAPVKPGSRKLNLVIDKRVD